MTRVGGEEHEIDMLGWMGRTALELIGQGGLGYSFDPLVEDRTDEYGDALKSLLCVASSTHSADVLSHLPLPLHDHYRRFAIRLIARATGHRSRAWLSFAS